MRRALALAPLLLIAGCLGPASESDPSIAGVARGPFVDPIVDEHDHADLAAHANLSTPTMHAIGYSSLSDEAAQFTSFAEMDTFGNVTVVAAVLKSDPPRGAIILVDMTDPSAPARLGFATIEDAGHPLDVKWDEAGEFVFASGNQRIYVFDARDPAAPALAGASVPLGAACHMSALGMVDGTEYYFCTGDALTMSVYQVVAPTPDTRTLAPVTVNPPPSAPDPSLPQTWILGAPHDMTFQLDPLDGAPILVVSNRGHGVRVVDVSDPRTPTTLGQWRGEGAEYWSNHMHTGMVTMVNGTRYVIVSPEILTEGYPPAIWFLDATDYADLNLVAEWWAPGEHPSPGFLLTTHQWQVAAERIYLGYYHAGVWVLDIPTILAGAYKDDPERPEVLGYYLPDEPPVDEGATVPNVWDVNLVRGLVYVTDISSGLHVLHYAPDVVGDEALSGFS